MNAFTETVKGLEVGKTKLIPRENVSTELCAEIQHGIILNLATWSGPAFFFFKQFYEILNDLNVPEAYVLNHDNSYEFQKKFDSPSSASCHGYCEIFVVKDSHIIYKSLRHEGGQTFIDLKNQLTENG